MLAEFALTPSIFDESAHSDQEEWRDQLRELGSNMFPRTAAWPVMISNLYEGSWENEALTLMKSIKDQKTRILCSGILTNIAKAMVKRPACGEWPYDDSTAWAEEALASHRGFPIDRIIGCNATYEKLRGSSDSIRCIEEVTDSGFWKDVRSSWSLPLKIDDQVASLRKISVHAGFICLMTPRIYGGRDDETDFAIELIKSAFDRPPEYGKVEIEIHTDGPDRPDSSDYETRLETSIRNIASTIREKLSPGQRIRLQVWKKLLDRYLIAGVHTEMEGDPIARSPRWGISMQHIARRSDERGSAAMTSWGLLNNSQVSDIFDRYCNDSTDGPIRTIDIHR